MCLREDEEFQIEVISFMDLILRIVLPELFLDIVRSSYVNNVRRCFRGGSKCL